MKIFIDSIFRPILSLPMGSKPRDPAPAQTGILSRNELQRIVAAMVG